MSAFATSLRGPVVVGVDGSLSSLSAVETAAREAQLRPRPLRVVHALNWPLLNVPVSGFQDDAERTVASAADRARVVAPDVEISTEIITGEAAAVLLGCSTNASLVVVGDRGLGGFTGLLVSSVAVQLAAHASCPVLVVRGDSDPAAPVLLGADGSPDSEAAVGFAFEEAALRGVPLAALHAWSHPVSEWPGDMLSPVYDVDETEAEESLVLAEALAGWREKYPDVVVRRRTVHRGPRRA
jgi:nucleotide-binding universal stress UspA family protein